MTQIKFKKILSQTCLGQKKLKNWQLKVKNLMLYYLSTKKIYSLRLAEIY